MAYAAGLYPNTYLIWGWVLKRFSYCRPLSWFPDLDCSVRFAHIAPLGSVILFDILTSSFRELDAYALARRFRVGASAQVSLSGGVVRFPSAYSNVSWFDPSRSAL